MLIIGKDMGFPLRNKKGIEPYKEYSYFKNVTQSS